MAEQPGTGDEAWNHLIFGLRPAIAEALGTNLDERGTGRRPDPPALSMLDRSVPNTRGSIGSFGREGNPGWLGGYL